MRLYSFWVHATEDFLPSLSPRFAELISVVRTSPQLVNEQPVHEEAHPLSGLSDGFHTRGIPS